MAAGCLAAPAWAQQSGRPDRPYRGLFGGGADQFAQTLIANGSVGAGFGNNMLAVPASSFDVRSTVPTGSAQGQSYGYVASGLSYSLTKNRVGFGASLATSGQYVPGVTTPFIPSHSGSVGGSLQLSRRSRLSANHTAYLQPYNVLVLGPLVSTGEAVFGQAVPIEPSVGVSREDHIAQFSSVGFNRQLGRRSAFDLSYDRFSSSASGGGETTRTAAGRFSRGLAKGLGVHLGYGYTEGHLLGASSTLVGHNIDAGLDFTRSLGFSISRRTKLSFSTGSSALTSRSRNVQHTYYVFTGTATLTREIARSWAAYINYNRGINFVERFSEPFMSDSASVGMGGLITRRLEFRTAAGAVIGKAGLSEDASPFGSYYSSVALTAALTRSLALGTDYSYYRYSFDRADQLPIGLAPQMGRHSARVYLSVWVPLLQRGRRQDAPR